VVAKLRVLLYWDFGNLIEFRRLVFNWTVKDRLIGIWVSGLVRLIVNRETGLLRNYLMQSRPGYVSGVTSSWRGCWYGGFSGAPNVSEGRARCFLGGTWVICQPGGGAAGFRASPGAERVCGPANRHCGMVCHRAILTAAA
jgi:hypothetical protein